MKRLALMVGLMLALAFGVMAVACGGDEEAEAEKAIEEALEDVAKDNGSDVDVDISGGKLPKDFPEGFPIYDGAKVTFSLASSDSDTGQGFMVTWETKDDAQKVVDFYSDKLAEDPWSIQTTSTTGDGAMFFFSGKAGDTPFAGMLIIAKESGKTTITLSAGEDTSE